MICDYRENKNWPFHDKGGATNTRVSVVIITDEEEWGEEGGKGG